MKNESTNMKGQLGLNMLQYLAIGLVVAGLLAAFGGSIMTSVGAGLPTPNVNSTAYNVTVNANAGILNLTAQFGNIGTIGAAVVLIGLLVGGLATFAQRGSR